MVSTPNFQCCCWIWSSKQANALSGFRGVRRGVIYLFVVLRTRSSIRGAIQCNGTNGTVFYNLHKEKKTNLKPVFQPTSEERSNYFKGNSRDALFLVVNGLQPYRIALWWAVSINTHKLGCLLLVPGWPSGKELFGRNTMLGWLRDCRVKGVSME